MGKNMADEKLIFWGIKPHFQLLSLQPTNSNALGLQWLFQSVECGRAKIATDTDMYDKINKSIDEKTGDFVMLEQKFN